MKKLLLAALLLPIIAVSCSKKESGEQDGYNAIVIRTSTDKGVEEIKTKAPESVEDTYWLTITGPDGYELSQALGSERVIPNLEPGSYAVALASKEPGSYTLPAMNLPIYEGGLTKEVSGVTNFTFTCLQSNTGVQFIFDSSVTDRYPSAAATITAEAGTGASLGFTPINETQEDIAYFEPGILRLVLKDGDVVIPIGKASYQDIEVAECELWTVTLKLSSETGNSIDMTVTVDKTVTPKEVEFEVSQLTGTGLSDSPFSVASAVTGMPTTSNTWTEGYILGSGPLTRSDGDDYIRIGLLPDSEDAQSILLTNLTEATIRTEMKIPAEVSLTGMRIAIQGAVTAKPAEVTAPALAVMEMRGPNWNEPRYSLNYFSDLKTSINYYCLNDGNKPNAVLKNARPGLRIGTAVRHEQLGDKYGWDQDPAYMNILKRDFNSVTAEYTMKMDWIWKEETYPNYNFGDVDKLLTFARDNGMRVHGHTLIFPEIVPDWLKTKGASWDQEQWTTLMEDYIDMVVTYCATKYPNIVQSWDVVNEAFGPDGTLWGGDSYPTNKNNFWYVNVGADYIEKAFRAAKKALTAAGDTQCKLFYNDYDLVSMTAKYTGVYDYFAGLLEKTGEDLVPIDGIGMQCHVEVVPDYAVAKAAFAKMASLQHADGTKLLVHLSELDAIINTPNYTGGTYYESWWQGGVPGYWKPDYDQGKSFNMIARAYLTNVDADQQFGITTWGITDRYSMTGTNNKGKIDWAVLFTKWNEPKSAYNGLLEALIDIDWVEKEGASDSADWRWEQGFSPRWGI